MTAGIWVFVAAMVAIFVGVVAVVILNEFAYRRDDLYAEPRPAVTRQAPRRPLPPLLLMMPSHSAPIEPLSTDRAHDIMQEHLSCLVAECPRKRAAWDTLRFAGHLTPDRYRA